MKFAFAVLFIASTSPVGAQVVQTLFSFNFTNGAYPEAAVTLGHDGNFYGTTANGGTNTDSYGTIFQITTNGTLSTLVFFSGTNGAYPQVALTLGNDGNFYGTTAEGGVFFGYEPNGTVFRVTSAGTLTTLPTHSSTIMIRVAAPSR